MDAFLGIDVAQATLSTHLLYGPISHSKTFANSTRGVKELLKWLDHHRCPRHLRACMEATSTYHLLAAQTLYQAGYTVHVANPYAVHEYGKSLLRRTKTDRADAVLLVEYCQSHRLHPWRPLPPELAELLALVRHRVSLRDRRAALRNQLHIAAEPSVKASLNRQIDFLTREISLADRAIREHLRAHPSLNQSCELLRSIPGIGEVTAPLLLAELGDISRFDNVRQVAAYAGLTPEAHESGSSIHAQPVLSRLGSLRLRCALYMPGVVVFRMRTLFAPFIERLLAENRPKMTIIAALMRKLLHLAYGVLKTGRPFDTDYAEGPAAKRAA